MGFAKAVVSTALAAGLLLAGGACASSAVDVPASTLSGPVPAERYGAPEVGRPREVTAVFQSPCVQLFTADELERLGVSGAGTPRSYLGSNQCSWRTGDDDLLALAVDNDRDLLVDTYRSRLTPIFLPDVIEGLPAVKQRTSTESNSCTVTVGLGPRQALEADWNGLAQASSGSDPCRVPKDALALVIRKLPPQR